MSGWRPEPTAPPASPAPEPVALREVPASTLWLMAWRSLLLQALWNPERMQGQGFAYAIRPLARCLVGKDREASWLMRHLGYFNTNPALAGCALGVVGRLENERSVRPESPGPRVENVKTALGSGLAALGDSLFWSTLRPLAAVLGVLWLLEGSPYGPLVLLILYNGFHLYARFRGVFIGYRSGLEAVHQWMRTRLTRVRSVLQVTGVIASAALVHALLDHILGEFQPSAGLWLGLGLAIGMIWGEKRRLSPAALGIGIFAVTLAWITLTR